MINKIFVLTIFCITIVLIGCGKKDKNLITFSVGGAPNEIVVWEKLISDFKEKSGIKVNILRQPTDTDQRRQGLITPLKSGEKDPDVFLMDVAWLAQFSASDWLEPIDNYAREDGTDMGSYFDKVINLADKYEGKLVALPVYVDGGLLYYNKDMLFKYEFKNPPKTWEELLEYSLKIQKNSRRKNPNFYSFVWQGAQYEGLICNFLEFAGSGGGGIIFKNNKILLNTPENRKALQFMHDIINKYKISPPNTFTEMKEEEVRITFQQGNAAFERNWPYAWALHQSENSQVENMVGIAPLPHFQGNRSVSTLGGWHIGISKYSDSKQHCWEFVKFITSFEIQKSLAMELGWNPGRKDIYTDKEVLKKLPHFKALRKVFENALPRPNLPYYTQISEIMQRYINSVLSGELTPKVALGRAQEESQKIVDRYQAK